MKKNLITVAVLTILVAMNILLLSRLSEFVMVYPFSRLMMDNRLLYPLGIADDATRFGNVVQSINGIRVSSGDVIRTLSSVPLYERLFVVVESGDRMMHLQFDGRTRNRDAEWFFILLMLCADLHFLWGFFVFMRHSYRDLADVYVRFVMGTGVLYLMIFDLYGQREMSPLFLLAGYFIACHSIIMEVSPARKTLLKRVMVIGTVLIALVPVANCVFSMRGDALVSARITALMIMTGIVFSIYNIIKTSIRLNNLSLWKRNVSIVLSVIIAYLAPVVFFLFPFFLLSFMPGWVIACIMPLFPLHAGSILVKKRLSEVREFPIKGVLATVMNIAVSVAGALLLFYIVHVYSGRISVTGIFALFILVMVLLLTFKYFFLGKIRTLSFQLKDYYANSLQNIAELVSSPAELELKIRRIYQEVKEFIGVRVLLFFLPEEEYSEKLKLAGDSITSYSKNHAFVKYYKKRNEIIVRHTHLHDLDLDSEIRDLMVEKNLFLMVPCFKVGDFKGVLGVGEKADSYFFSNQDISYLQTVSMQLYQLIENDRLFDNYIIKRNYEKELDIASYVQLRLLPRETPAHQGIRISFYNRPYKKVTGDYFDFIKVDRDKTAIVLGDVSGHGLSASMILSMTSSIVNAMLMEKKSIEKAVEEVNHFLNHRYRGVDLISLFIGTYNRRTRELIYINAGHCPPLVMHRGKTSVSVLEGRSKILGADPAANYFSSKTILNRGDEVLLYTDGLIEMYDEHTDNHLNESALVKLLVREPEKDMEEKLKMIIEHINNVDREAIRDDITLIGITAL